MSGVDLAVESEGARWALSILEGQAAVPDDQRRACAQTVRGYLERVEGVANLRGDALKKIATGAVSPAKLRKREVDAVFGESTLRLFVPPWDVMWLTDLAMQCSQVPMRLVLRAAAIPASTPGAERFTVEDATVLHEPNTSTPASDGDRVVVVTLADLELEQRAASFTIASQKEIAASPSAGGETWGAKS